MIYNKVSNKILIYGLEDFNIEHILFCGQVFRFEYSQDKNGWYVYSSNKRALVCEDRQKDIAIIYTDDVDYFENYFDLKTSYADIKRELKEKKLDFLDVAIDKYYGIRILNQDIFETFFSFLISSNNNIKRIQKIINTLCLNLGTKIDDYYAFPEYEQLKNVTYEQFLSFGLGYRAKYFVECLKKMQKGELEENFKNLSTQDLRSQLMKFCGVGEKVADCIMLFGYKISDSFPCDVWIEKMYNKYFEEETNRSKISKKLVEYFGNLSGYAQQYLFYYIKENTKN